MTTTGWIFMVASVGIVTLTMIWCFYRVLAKPSATKHMHAPLDIDTHDKGT